MLFYWFFLNKLHNTHNKRKSTPATKNINLFVTPKVFHYPKLKVTISVPPKINKILPNSLRDSSQFRSIYSWSKPTLFIKKSRLLFLYYFFLKNNNKSLSTIFLRLKKSKTTAIMAFFMKTVGYVLDIFFKVTTSKGLSDFTRVNLKKISGNWYQLNPNSIVQLVWCSSSINQSNRGRIRQNRSTISLDSSHMDLTYGGVSGVVDYRTNSLFLMSVRRSNLENLNFLNLNVTSVYNWKIII